MLNAWINKRDIEKLLSKSKSIDDLISKNDFLNGIVKIKQYKKPQKNSQNTRRPINNIIDIKNRIKKYQNEVRFEQRESYIEKLGETEKKALMNGYYYYEELEMRMNVIPKEYLSDIIKVSERTIARWKKKGVIYADRRYYYDLSIILAGLKPLK